MSSTLGFALTFERDARDAPDLQAALVDFVVRPIWGKPLRYFAPQAIPGQEVRRAGALTKDALVPSLTEAIAAEATSCVYMSTTAKEDAGYARIWFDTQRKPWSKPLCDAAGHRPSEGTSTHADWLAAVLVLMERAPAMMGCVFVMPSRWEASSEGTLGAIMVNGKVAHPFPKQFERMSRAYKELGTRYVRFPRWGTLYSHAHVAALGGTARIVEVVQPAVVRELPGGVYFQLTDSLDTAQSEESTRKRRAFTELAEPLLPPPLPAT